MTPRKTKEISFGEVYMISLGLVVVVVTAMVVAGEHAHGTFWRVVKIMGSEP